MARKRFSVYNTRVMANEQIRKVGSFGDMKFKNLQRHRQHDNGRIQSIPAAPELHSETRELST